MIWIKYFVSLFPNIKVLVVDKKKSGQMKNRSIEGERFEKMEQYNYELFTEIGDDLKCNNRKCDFDKMNKDVDYFNKVMDWCGLPTKTKEEHYQMLVDLKYDGIKNEIL
jgi:formiminotetrahydrofolate cyclodeaminase